MNNLETTPHTPRHLLIGQSIGTEGVPDFVRPLKVELEEAVAVRCGELTLPAVIQTAIV